MQPPGAVAVELLELALQQSDLPIEARQLAGRRGKVVEACGRLGGRERVHVRVLGGGG
jgi:hypothetical protein